MGERLELHAILEQLLGSDKAFFQPPTDTAGVLTYPCIVYYRDALDADYADNNPYRVQKRYLITVMYRNPDSDLPMKIAQLPTANHRRNYRADGLYHDAFDLFF